MIKLLFFVTRKPGSTAEEFHEYWGNRHAVLVSGHAKTFGIVKYHQSHATTDSRNEPNDVFPQRYDGVAEIWFESQQDLESWFKNDTPETIAAGKEIRNDERKFVDRSNSPYMIAEDRPIID